MINPAMQTLQIRRWRARDINPLAPDKGFLRAVSGTQHCFLSKQNRESLVLERGVREEKNDRHEALLQACLEKSLRTVVLLLTHTTFKDEVLLPTNSFHRPVRTSSVLIMSGPSKRSLLDLPVKTSSDLNMSGPSKRSLEMENGWTSIFLGFLGKCLSSHFPLRAIS